MRCFGAVSHYKTAPAATLFLVFLLSGGASFGEDQTLSASIWIDAGRVEHEISPYLYGQFLEFMFEGIKYGLHAELLRNRSFEAPPDLTGLSRYWERDPDDRNHNPALFLRWDDSVQYPEAQGFEGTEAEHSQRIDVTTRPGERRGLYQSRIPVDGGRTYHGSIWIKTTGFSGYLEVALEEDRVGGERLAGARIENVEGDWKKYEFVLRPNRNDPLARFVILIYGVGRLWIDKVSLMPEHAIDGVRAEVFERIQALSPSFIRWPGGNVAQDYHWIWGIGPRDERPDWTNLSWNNEREPGDFGTHEFIRLCRNLGVEPSITVNVEGRGATAEEAAAWVEYCNGSAESEWGRRRAENGHPEPFGVRFWELGNEIWGDWVRGHSDAKTYARHYARYHEAMHAVDPTIRFIGVGDNDLDWNRTVLEAVGEKIDYLAIHHYYGESEMGGDVHNLLARPLRYDRFYQTMRRMIREIVSGKDVKLAINEWNTALLVPRQHSLESALYGARLMNVFERNGDLIHMSAVSDLVNGWPGGIIQASRHDVFVTPTYWVNYLYSRHRGDERLFSRVESPVFDTTREGKDIPYLDVSVTRSRDDGVIFVKAVNVHPEKELRTTVYVSGATVRDKGEWKILTADSLAAFNSFRTPDTVSVQERQIATSPEFVVTLPRHSISVIVLATP